MAVFGVSLCCMCPDDVNSELCTLVAQHRAESQLDADRTNITLDCL
jgi:hypothetical protein